MRELDRENLSPSDGEREKRRQFIGVMPLCLRVLVLLTSAATPKEREDSNAAALVEEGIIVLEEMRRIG